MGVMQQFRLFLEQSRFMLPAYYPASVSLGIGAKLYLAIARLDN